MHFGVAGSPMPAMEDAKPGAASLEKQIRDLLRDLCVDWGFCIPPADIERIAGRAQLEAYAFAAEVVRAEGMTPEHEKKWTRRIAERFRDRFGDRVSAEAD
ncbi:MAG: hypothetical protein HKM95_00185 [Inquilinus sp.]|nr:hypothetical protein [Inquilinus sp.]